MAAETQITHGKAIVGAGTGIVVPELVSEIAARSAGVTGVKRFGVKTLVKVGFAGLFYALTGRVGAYGVAMLVAVWSCLGTIFVDVISLVVEGGIPRIAERAAVKVRGMALGAKAVTKELEQLEMKASTTREVNSTREVAPAISQKRSV